MSKVNNVGSSTAVVKTLFCQNFAAEAARLRNSKIEWRFCETPFKAKLLDPRDRRLSILFGGHVLRRFENLSFAMLIKAKHNRASSDDYIVGASFFGFDLRH